MAREQAFGFGATLLRFVVAVHNVHEFHPGVLGILEGLFHALNPIILIGSVGGGGEDGKPAFVMNQ